ncbi:MAG: class I SAM-dependent methyltransferase [Methylobacter sp.]|jgi:2-polyprenyl-3-methyl-5-hydroxy-6-metoxy-1,4-benzoquinol methylase|nr:class I SAM-dependent methyltransferase [Methylobacter sp.]
MIVQRNDLSDFIAGARASVIEQCPNRQEYFDIYANEARFGFSIIETEFEALQPGSLIMEVGAGMLILSGYLASKGMEVYALEPIAGGFSHFRELQNAVLKHYEKIGLKLNLIESPIESFSNTEYFDYVYSINVFEHISDVESGLSNAYLSLKTGGTLRVYCPNYQFPYEPHFNIPTLFNKRLTEAVFKPSILKSSQMHEALETWEALNWINVSQVRRLFRKRFGKEPIFNRLVIYQIVSRVLSDPQFAARRSRWVFTVLQMLNRVGFLQLFKFFPVSFSPAMDFSVKRN